MAVNLSEVKELVFKLSLGENKLSEVMIRKELDDNIDINTNTSPIVFNIYRAVTEEKAIKYVRISSISVESTADFRDKIVEVFTYNNMRALAGKQVQLSEEDYKELVSQLTAIVNYADLGVYTEDDDDFDFDAFGDDAFGDDAFGDDDIFTGDVDEMYDIEGLKDEYEDTGDFTEEEIAEMIRNTCI